jgi:hypothetical protein
MIVSIRKLPVTLIIMTIVTVTPMLTVTMTATIILKALRMKTML